MLSVNKIFIHEYMCILHQIDLCGVPKFQAARFKSVDSLYPISKCQKSDVSFSKTYKVPKRNLFSQKLPLATN